MCFPPDHSPALPHPEGRCRSIAACPDRQCTAWRRRRRGSCWPTWGRCASPSAYPRPRESTAWRRGSRTRAKNGADRVSSGMLSSGLTTPAQRGCASCSEIRQHMKELQSPGAQRDWGRNGRRLTGRAVDCHSVKNTGDAVDGRRQSGLLRLGSDWAANCQEADGNPRNTQHCRFGTWAHRGFLSFSDNITITVCTPRDEYMSCCTKSISI